MLTTIDRTEHLGDITFAANSTLKLPTPSGLIPNDRFISRLLIEFSGRLTCPAANDPTAILADTVYGLIERLRVRGFHVQRRAEEQFIDVRGSDLREWNRIYQGSDPQAVGVSTVSHDADATNDIRFMLEIPMYPQNIPYRQRASYLLDAPNYQNLTLEIQTADYKSVYTPGSAAVTYSAYGSATGSATIRVHAQFAMSKTNFSGFVPGRNWLYSAEVSGDKMTNTASAVRLYDFARGYRQRAVLLKTGVKSANVTAPNNAFLSLSDDILANIRFNRGLNHPIRRYADMRVMREEVRIEYGIAPNTGYALIDWAKQGNLNDALDTRGLVSGPNGAIDCYLEADVTGVASQALSLLVSEIRTVPSPPPQRR